MLPILFIKTSYMSTPPAPKSNWNNVSNFFFGSPKRVRNTFIFLVIIASIVFADKIAHAIQVLIYKITNIAIDLVNHLAQPIIAGVLIILGFKFLFRKVGGK